MFLFLIFLNNAYVNELISQLVGYERYFNSISVTILRYGPSNDNSTPSGIPKRREASALGGGLHRRTTSMPNQLGEMCTHPYPPKAGFHQPRNW